MSSVTPSSAFESLHPKIQEWIWREGWDVLRDIQEEAIPIIVEGRSDVLIASATASGKTEAAFLPIASCLATNDCQSLGALYIGPLKALINDQCGRLEKLFNQVDLPVFPWHGDISGSIKKRVFSSNRGLLLITPESLEALFVRRGPELKTLFSSLQYIVVDELHAFIGSERGRQLQSLLNRVQILADRVVPRIALSATIGDLEMAANFLRPDESLKARAITSDQLTSDVLLQVRGYLQSRPETGRLVEDQESQLDSDQLVARDIFDLLRGGRHLIFGNSRATVERYSDSLRRKCEDLRVPNEFLPHHGNLDKSLREAAEKRLREESVPTSVIATTTLELGIDVGSVESIAIIGSPHSVSSLRQRLGRSGRRGSAAVLRMFIQESVVDQRSSLQDELRSGLVQTIAMVRLLIERWYEPPNPTSLHLSTLVQQILSVVCEYGGIYADTAYRFLCHCGPFSSVSPELFASVLRQIGEQQLLTQTQDGLLLLGVEGERVVNHYTFYAAFTTTTEYRIVSDAATLGTYPMTQPLLVGSFIIFGGRRWRVEQVDDRHRIIHVTAARGGRVPRFSGGGLNVHERVRKMMKAIYMGDSIPEFLNAPAVGLLAEGRETFARYQLDARSIVVNEGGLLFFPWIGDRGVSTLELAYKSLGISATNYGLALGFKTDELTLLRASESLRRAFPPSRHMASLVVNKMSQKYHPYLSDELLVEDIASSMMDRESAQMALLALCDYSNS